MCRAVIHPELCLPRSVTHSDFYFFFPPQGTAQFWEKVSGACSLGFAASPFLCAGVWVAECPANPLTPPGAACDEQTWPQLFPFFFSSPWLQAGPHHRGHCAHRPSLSQDGHHQSHREARLSRGFQRPEGFSRLLHRDLGSR